MISSIFQKQICVQQNYAKRDICAIKNKFEIEQKFHIQHG